MPGTETGPSPDETSPLPPAARLLAHTPWHEFEHAYAPGDIDLAATLAHLLHPQEATRLEALGRLQGTVHHQNTICPATTPVALYITALLHDPRSEPTEVRDGLDRPLPLRAALLSWIAQIAYDTMEEVTAKRGFGFMPEEAAFRAIRPRLLEAVTVFTASPDARIRHAASAAALRLLDTDVELRRHQLRYAAVVEEILETSTSGHHRATALDALTAWGQDTTARWEAEMGRRQAEAAARQDGTWWAGTFATEPPF